VTGILKRKSLALVVYALLLATGLLFTRIPAASCRRRTSST
jgi:hypothetical protein